MTVKSVIKYKLGLGRDKESIHYTSFANITRKAGNQMEACFLVILL